MIAPEVDWVAVEQAIDTWLGPSTSARQVATRAAVLRSLHLHARWPLTLFRGDGVALTIWPDGRTTFPLSASWTMISPFVAPIMMAVMMTTSKDVVRSECIVHVL